MCGISDMIPTWLHHVGIPTWPWTMLEYSNLVQIRTWSGTIIVILSSIKQLRSIALICLNKNVEWLQIMHVHCHSKFWQKVPGGNVIILHVFRDWSRFEESLAIINRWPFIWIMISLFSVWYSPCICLYSTHWIWSAYR